MDTPARSTQQPDHPTPPPLDIAQMLARCMNQASIATLLLDKFEVQLRRDLEAITREAGAGDGQALARAAHALKGAAASMAAGEVTRAAAALEQAGKSGRLELAREGLERLRVEIDRCLAYLPVAQGEVGRGASSPPRPAE